MSWSVANSGTLTINQSVGTVTGTSKLVNVGTVAGTKTYTLTNTRTLNGVTRNATSSTAISVLAAKVCNYVASTYVWNDFTVTTPTPPFLASHHTSISWNGTNIYNGVRVATYTSGGFTYTKGTAQNSGGLYQVCRE